MPYQFLDFELDPARYQLRRGATELSLPPRIFDLILLLIRYRDRPVSKSEILSTIWHGRTVTEASLTHAITHARKALGDTSSTQSIIKTIHGRGYWWVAETREVGGPSQSSKAPFVGREYELNQLRNGLDGARRLSGRLVIIVGEPGAGKTRLVDEFLDDATRLGAIPVKACAEDFQPTPPFYLWRQVIRKLTSLSKIDLPSRLAWLSHDELSHEYHAESPVTDAEASLESAFARAALCDSLSWYLGNAVRPRPLLLVLEDLHRADSASLQALSQIAPALAREMILVVGTQRPSPMTDERLRAHLARLARMTGASTLLLPSLSREDVFALLVELADPRIPPEAADLVFEACGGNPFLLWQVVGVARSRSGLRSPTDLANLPTAARAAISLHIADLPLECSGAVRVAAVTGPSFDATVLARVLDLPLSRVATILSSVEHAGLIRSIRPGRFEFVHALLREAIYEEMDLHERAQLHLEAGRAMLEIVGADAEDQLPAIAAHFREARLVGGREEAKALLERAGLSAMHRLAFSDAVTYLADALMVVRECGSADPESDLRILLALGTAKMCAGDREGARRTFLQAAEIASARERPELLAEAALRMAPSVLSLETGVVDPLLIELLEKALALAPRDNQALRTELVGRLALALYWSEDDARRKDLIDELRTFTPHDPDRRRRVQLFSMAADWGPDSLADRRSVLDQFRRSPIQPRGPLDSIVRIFRASTLLEIGDLDGMRRESAILESELRSRGEPYGAWYPKMFGACRALARADFSGAIALARDYAEEGRRFEDANVVHAFAAQIGDSLWMRGGAESALPGIERLVDQHPNMTEWRAVRVFFQVLAGYGAEVEDELERIAHRRFSGVQRTMSWTVAMCSLAEVVVRRRCAKWAPILLELLLPYRTRNAVAGFGVLSWGCISRFLGQLSALMNDLDKAVVLIEEAIRLEALAGGTAWVVRSEFALADVLRRYPDVERRRKGGEVAARVHARAGALGMTQIVTDIRTAGLLHP